MTEVDKLAESGKMDKWFFFFFFFFSFQDKYKGALSDSLSIESTLVANFVMVTPVTE